MVTLRACAKLNLSLEVLGRRSDGYHEITSVLQALSLADVLTIEPASKLDFKCPDVRGIRASLLEEAVLKTADTLRKVSGYRGGAFIKLEEIHIPRAAGLGASASLPAAVLKGLSEVWQLRLSLDTLVRLAAGIGSDVPFFLYGRAALVEGRGERVTPLPSPPLTWIVLLNPSLNIKPSKTATLYASLTPSHFTSGAFAQGVANSLKQHSRPKPSTLYNTFQSVAFDFFPQLRECRRMFLEAGACEVHLTGAGPVLFSLMPNREYGEMVVERLNTQGLEAHLTHTI